MGGQAAKDYTGVTIGRLTILGRTVDNKWGQIQVECSCVCGKIITRPLNKILLQKAPNGCGCGKIKDVSGQRFGKLTAIKLSDNYVVNSIHYWDCVCDCGGETKAALNHLTSGRTKSCGCGQGNYTHGLCSKFHRLYKVWSGMKNRCNNSKCESYYNYGGRGIFVCERWNTSFPDFISDMGKCPRGFTLERKDNDGPYSPENCVWSSRKTQTRNRRCVRAFEYKGKWWSFVEFAEKYKMTRSCLQKRIKLGWSFKEIIQGSG